MGGPNRQRPAGAARRHRQLDRPLAAGVLLWLDGPPHPPSLPSLAEIPTILQIEGLSRYQLLDKGDMLVERMRRVPGVVSAGRTTIGVEVPGLEGTTISDDATIQLFYAALDWHLPLTGSLDLFLSGGAGGVVSPVKGPAAPS